jgi:hypothetical protein
MSDKTVEQFFREPKRAYPWLVLAVALIVGAYVVSLYTPSPGWAVVAFAAGLIVAALGVRIIRQPIARLSGHVLTLADPRGISFRTRIYSLRNIQRVSIETHRQNVPNRFRRGVLMVNLTGVPAPRVEAFVQAIRARDVQVDY